MRHRILFAPLVFFVFLSTATMSLQEACGGQIYMWVDEKGVQHLSTTPPTKARDGVKTFSFKDRDKAPAPLPEKGHSPVTILNNQVLVSARIIYRRKEVTATLLLDTGASMTVLHRKLARELQPAETMKAEVQVAGGKVLTADLIEADSMRVGPVEKKNVVISIIDHAGPEPPFDGLLGMNFLRGLDYSIDFDRQRILWKKSEQ